MSHLRTIPLLGMKLGDVIRAGERAVAAAKALVVQMLDNPGERVFLEGIDRARIEAGGVEAMVTRRGDMLKHRQAGSSADQQANLAPRLAIVEPVERMAGRHTRLAARTAIQIHVEGELLSRARRARRQERSSSTGLEAARLRFRGTARIARRRSSRPARSKASRPAGRAPRIPRPRAGERDRHGFDFLVEAHRPRYS